MRTKKLWLTGLSLLTFGLLAGCEQEAESDTSNVESGKITLDFWSFWGSGARRDVVEEIIADFNESQDEIEVEYTYQPWGDIWTKSLSAITAGNPPDVIVQDINSVGQRAEAKQSTNLSSYTSDGVSALFYPQLWETTLYQEEPYAVPFNTDTQVIFYNKTLFEEAGLTEEELPETWEELETVAHQLDKKDGDTFTQIGFYPLWNLGADVWALNADEGTSWFDEDGNVQIDTENKTEALEWILDWQQYYGQDTINRLEAEFGSGVSDPFISGTLAMRAQNINYYSSLMDNAPEDFDFGVIALPEKESGSGHWSWGGGFVLEVPYGAENPEASYKFIEYLTSTAVQEKFGEKSFDIMANEEANKNLISSTELTEKGQMIYKMADKNLANTIITPIPLHAPDYTALVNEQIDRILLGEVSPEEGLAEAQQSVEDLVEQNK